MTVQHLHPLTWLLWFGGLCLCLTTAPVWAEEAAAESTSQAPLPAASVPPVFQVKPSPLAAFQGKPIRAVELKVMREAIRLDLSDILPIKVGDTLSLSAISRAIELLYRQGSVLDVLAEGEALQDGVLLRFKVWPAIVVRKVRFKGNREILDRNLIGQVTLREGSSYSFAEAKNQARQLERYYEVEGFRSARVVPEALRAPRGQMDVTFRVIEGPQTHIRELRFLGNEYFSPRLLQQVSTLEEGRPFRSEMVEASRQALQRFYVGERHLEARVRPVTVFEDNEKWVTLKFEIEEGPRVRVEFYRTRTLGIGPFGGEVWSRIYSHLPFAYEDGQARKVGPLARQSLLTLLDLDAEQQFTDAFAEEGAERIRSGKITEGYEGTRVTTETVPSGNGRDAIIQFIIDPGRKIRLSGFRFSGNSFYASEQLEPLFREAMERYAPRGVYTTEAFDQAIALMTEYYHSQGFLDVRLVPSVTVDTQTLNRSAAVALQVEEGPRTLVQQVLLPEQAPVGEGASFGSSEAGSTVPVSLETLRSLVTILPGEPYDPARVKANVEAIQKAYASQGYVYARVDVKRDRVGSDQTGVSVRFEIEPGVQAHFGALVVRGSRYTRPEVIKRQLAIKSGAVYDPAQVEKTRQNLADMGLFSRVSLYPLGGERVRDMMVEVGERKAISAAFSLGVQFSSFALDASDARVDSTFELTNYNVLGRGHRASMRFELASSYPPTLPDRGSMAIFPDYLSAVGLDLLSYLDKASTRRLVLNYQAPFVDGPFGARTFSSTVTGTFFERARQSSWLLNRNSLAWAVSSEIGAHSNLYLQAQSTLRKPELEETDTRLILWPVDQQVRLYGQASGVLIFDQRNDKARPTNGYLVSLQGELGQGFGCGENWTWNSLNPCGTASLATAEGWLKTSLSASALWTPIPWVRLEARTQGGYLHPFGSDDGAVGFEKRFYLGGASTVRGFAQDWLGPHRFRDKMLPDSLVGTATAVPTGGNAMFWYSTELLVPLEKLWGALADMELAFFRDSGNVFWVGPALKTFNAAVAADAAEVDAESSGVSELAGRCASLIDAGGLRSSLGLGLRYRTSIGPMRFDVGFPQGALCSPLEPSFVMHISIGLF